MIDKTHLITYSLAIISLVFSIGISLSSFNIIKDRDNDHPMMNYTMLEGFLKPLPGFDGMVISSANIPENQLILRYASLGVSDRNHHKVHNLKVPLFDIRDDAINERTVQLIDHQPICVTIDRFIIDQYLQLPVDARYTCSIGIPPTLGEFHGIVTVYLNRIPTLQEEQTVVSHLLRISRILSTP